MRIAYQGEPGAFSEAAARQVNAEAQLVPCKSFEDVFAAVQERLAERQRKMEEIRKMRPAVQRNQATAPATEEAASPSPSPTPE